jgi:methylthioribose-1-phosphate isomerase
MPGDRTVVMMDQRKLPTLERYELLTRCEQVAEGIREMLVRGAPAIGIAAAYGMVLAAAEAPEDGPSFLASMTAAARSLRATRPTAVNLGWAVDRMMRVTQSAATEPASRRVSMLAAEARSIHVSEVAACKAMGKLGAEHVRDGATILTHCNAGALATAGYGTALGVIRAAAESGKNVRVLATETRPYLQGARITAWELSRDGIHVEVITDSMVGHFMSKEAIDLVVVGADRIARSGDVANKVGTYGIACLAHHHDVPFYVAAPWSTVDLECPSGGEIPIEERGEREVTHIGDTQLVPDGVTARHPAFDVTPAGLVTALFTERGVAAPLGEPSLADLARREPSLADLARRDDARAKARG